MSTVQQAVRLARREKPSIRVSRETPAATMIGRVGKHNIDVLSILEDCARMPVFISA